ncbi:GNAT family N-acetyltransferase [Microlunatus capsulatus]|uniref:GNAT family N-acetyltransferase n=1 Tax=Microlunatus capsulatus TaxID=99117 RepID=UPI0031D57500
MLIRPRTEADVVACVALMRRTHEADGYPRYWRDDPAAFLRGAAEEAAWVAEDDDGTVLGHVGLHAAAGDPTLPAARRATGLPPDRLAVVARLLVSPGARRRGVGRALLARVTAQAHADGRRPALVVLPEDAGPVGLYEAAGWRRLEPLTLAVEGHPDLHLQVYLGPPPA